MTIRHTLMQGAWHLRVGRYTYETSQGTKSYSWRHGFVIWLGPLRFDIQP